MKTALKIVSVLQLICGILLLVLGVLTTGMFAAADAEALAALSIVLLVIVGVADTVSAVLGLRAAKDAAKAMPAVVVGAIALIGSVINLISMFNGQALAACIIPAIYFFCALGLKKNAR